MKRIKIQLPATKTRNPVARAMASVRLGAGTHEKTDKALRRKSRIELAKALAKPEPETPD